MKNILIITYYYKHKNAMASVRAIKLAKYLSRLGYDVTVLTSAQIDTWTKNYLNPVPDDIIREFYAPQVQRWTSIRKFLDYRRRSGEEKEIKAGKKASADIKLASANVVGNKKTRLKGKIISYLKWQFYFNLAKQEDICMFKGLKKEYKRNGSTEYDTVIATYPTYGAFLMGIWLKKRGYCKQLIADFRDPLYNPGFRNRKQEAKFDKKCLQNILNVADRVVCVSRGIADGIVKEFPSFKKPIDIITNGYDTDDVRENNIPVNFDKSKIHFVYTGTLYHGKRCVDMLAEVLRELIQEEKISGESFIFEYAGPDYSELLNQLEAYGLEHTAVDHGFVTREESIALQKHADALILLTWNEKSYRGVVPGKLFEYMSIGTVPILALITGDVVDSEVSQLIKQSHSGIACEEAEQEQKIALKAYVGDLFERKLIFKSKAEMYDYKVLSERYAQFI